MALEASVHRVHTIAKVCHEVNRAYCESHGDTSQVPWEACPEWQRISAIEGVLFHLGNPSAPASASHDAWMKYKVEDGWKFGYTKNSERKTHPCIRPFDELSDEQKAKDYIFKEIVHQMKDLPIHHMQGAL